MSFDLVAAPFTPFTAGGDLNLSVIPHYAAFLRRNHVGGVFICGSTGEAPSLTLEERLQITASWAKVCDDSFKLIVNVGDTCLLHSQKLAAHARDAGAHGIAALAPYYFKPRTVEDLVRWCAKIASSAAPLPFYYYHMPEFTGVTFPVADFLATAQDRIPTLAGAKYSGPDLADFEASVKRPRSGSALRFYFGKDEWLIEGLRRGAVGAVGTTYNYAAPLYNALVSDFAAGDEAAATLRQATALRMIEICAGAGVSHLAAAKALMSRIGVPCGPVREPLAPLPEEQMESLLSKLNTIGFDQFCCK